MTVQRLFEFVQKFEMVDPHHRTGRVTAHESLKKRNTETLFLAQTILLVFHNLKFYDRKQKDIDQETTVS